MTTLYIDRKGLTCRYENQALIFYEGDYRYSAIPTHPLERVIFHSSVTLETSVLNHLGQQGIGVTCLGGLAHQPTLFLPAQTQDAHRRLAQYLLSIDVTYQRALVQKLLDAKFSAQQSALETLQTEHAPHTGLENAIQTITSAKAQLTQTTLLSKFLGIEGQVATTYFQALAAYTRPELKFKSRNRRPPKDPFNAILSLAYTLLYSEAALSLHTHGLDPYVGFFHALESGRASLACDVIEPIRPQVDLFALSLFETGTLTVAHFTQSAKGCFLSKEGRRRFYPAYEEGAQAWRPTLQKQVKDLYTQIELDFSLRQSSMTSSTPNAYC